MYSDEGKFLGMITLSDHNDRVLVNLDCNVFVHLHNRTPKENDGWLDIES